MSMSMSGTATSTATSTPMASSAMAMSSTGTMSMSMADMSMVFFTSDSTPLYSSAWIPSTAGQYAGTCIFLILLSIIFRALLAFRTHLPTLLAWNTRRRETSILHKDDSIEDGIDDVDLPPRPMRRPWKINEAVVWAVTDTVLAGVSYLL